MNILFLESGKNFGGQELRSIIEIQALRQRGHQVEFILKPDTPTEAKALDAGIPVHTLPLKNALDIKSISWLIYHIQTQKIDILHANSAKDAWIGGIAARLAPRRPAFIRTRHITNPIKHSYAYSKLPDSLHVLTHSRRDIFIREHGVDPSKIHVFYPPVDLSRYDDIPSQAEARKALGVHPDAWVWMNIAQFRGEKGHLTLLEAFAKAAQSVPEALLLLVGADNENYMQVVKDRAAQLGVLERVMFTGFQKEVPKILPAADLFFMSSSVEPFGMVIIESFAAGVPVIATRTEGALELIEDQVSGFLVDIDDFQAMSDTALALHQQPELAKQCAQTAKMTVDRFSLDTEISLLEQHYKEMAQRCRRF